MICMEVDGMKKVLFKVIVPAVIIAVWMLTCYPVCNKAEGFDWFLYWIIVGCPFGIRRMFLWLIPKNFGISGSRRAYPYCNRTLLDEKSKSGNIELLDILSKGGAVRTWLLFYCQKGRSKKIYGVNERCGQSNGTGN